MLLIPFWRNEPKFACADKSYRPSILDLGRSRIPFPPSGRQTEIGHQLPRVVEAREVAHFGDDDDSCHEGDTAHRLERLDDGRHRPIWNQLLDLLRQASDPLFSVMHGVDVVPQDNLLSRVVEAKRRQRAAVGQRPSFLGGIDAAMPSVRAPPRCTHDPKP